MTVCWANTGHFHKSGIFYLQNVCSLPHRDLMPTVLYRELVSTCRIIHSDNGAQKKKV